MKIFKFTGKSNKSFNGQNNCQVTLNYNNNNLFNFQLEETIYDYYQDVFHKYSNKINLLTLYINCAQANTVAKNITNIFSHLFIGPFNSEFDNLSFKKITSKHLMVSFYNIIEEYDEELHRFFKTNKRINLIFPKNEIIRLVIS